MKLFPSIESAVAPGATPATAVGVFLAYTSPIYFVLGVGALFNQDWIEGIVLTLVGVGAWIGGHRLAGR